MAAQRRIGLVGCVKTKTPHSAPAADLYVSPLFRGRRRYVEGSCGEWFVLSAKHGLLAPDETIEPYDLTLNDLTPAQRHEWSGNVLAQIDERLGPVDGLTFEIHAGAMYRTESLIDGLRRRGAVIEVPAEGLNQGQQLAFYQGQRATASSSGGTYGPLQALLDGVDEPQFVISFSEIEAVLGRQLPASARAHRPWWANSSRTPQASAWMSAGWRVASINGRTEQVRFERTSSTPTRSPVESVQAVTIRDLLTDASRARLVSDIKRQDHPAAGLYSWWADDEARRVIGTALGIETPPLVYIGQAGATRQPSGTPSSATLGSRIAGQHAGGNIGSSTFRLTISAILATTRELETDSKGALTRDANAFVTGWIGQHLRVATVAVADRDKLASIEAEIVAAVNPPLNLDHVPANDHRNRLRELRQQLRAKPAPVSVLPAPTPTSTVPTEEGSWLLRIEQVDLSPIARQRTSPAALSAVARLAEQVPAIRQALLSAPPGQASGLRVVFSPAVQRALENGSLRLMGSGPEKLAVAVNAAGRTVQIGRVAPTGLGAAGVATIAAPPLWPVALAAALALAASYAEQRWLEQTFGQLRDAMQRLEHRMRDDDAGALTAADELVSLLTPDGQVGALPQQLRIELALARRQVDAVYLARRRFVERFKRTLEAAQTEHEVKTGQRAAWAGKVAEELADRRSGVVDELVLFLQAMIARARLGAITASVLAADGDSLHAVRLLSTIEDEMRTDYFDLHNRIAALARGERIETTWDRLRGAAGKRVPMLAGGTDDEGIEVVRSVEKAMRETVGAAMPERDRVVDLVVPIDELLELERSTAQ